MGITDDEIAAALGVSSLSSDKRAELVGSIRDISWRRAARLAADRVPKREFKALMTMISRGDQEGVADFLNSRGLDSDELNDKTIQAVVEEYARLLDED